MILEAQLRALVAQHAESLQAVIAERLGEMAQDDTSHQLIYRVLGISPQESQVIDRYQNIGRFVYRYAGALVEQATMLCLQAAFPSAQAHKVHNPERNKPQQFEIDCLVGQEAYEIKWRDATTDGDHIAKEHARIRAIAQAGYRPLRLMYFTPNRRAARRIQAIIADLYRANGGYSYEGSAAWEHLQAQTGINLLALLQQIDHENHP